MHDNGSSVVRIYGCTSTYSEDLSTPVTPRRAIRPAFGATGISDDWYGSTMGAVVKSLEAPGTVAQPMGNPKLTLRDAGF